MDSWGRIGRRSLPSLAASPPYGIPSRVRITATDTRFVALRAILQAINPRPAASRIARRTAFWRVPPDSVSITSELSFWRIITTIVRTIPTAHA